MAVRAVVFVDGNNWHHSLRDVQVEHIGRLDFRKISRKVVGIRSWHETRYYIGQVPQTGNPKLYASQRRFLASLRAADRRISVHLGRLEPRSVKSAAARDLKRYLTRLPKRIDRNVFHDLMQIASRHKTVPIMVEKAVDVMLAVDMVIMAERDAYDAAYLLSADGDFTPAVDAVRAHGKKVYAVSPKYGAKLAGHVDTFIRLKKTWFSDCY